jgi:hypothetical protein
LIIQFHKHTGCSRKNGILQTNNSLGPPCRSNFYLGEQAKFSFGACIIFSAALCNTAKIPTHKKHQKKTPTKQERPQELFASTQKITTIQFSHIFRSTTVWREISRTEVGF